MGWCVGKVSGIKKCEFLPKPRQQATRLYKKWDENSWKKIWGDEKSRVHHPPRQFFFADVGNYKTSNFRTSIPMLAAIITPPPAPLWIAKSFYYIALFYLLATLARKMHHGTHQKNPKKSKIGHFFARIFFNPRGALLLRPKFQTFYMDAFANDPPQNLQKVQTEPCFGFHWSAKTSPFPDVYPSPLRIEFGHRVPRGIKWVLRFEPHFIWILRGEG